MFPHVVTLYTLETVADPATLEDTTTAYITVLRFVLLDALKKSAVSTQGYDGEDAVTLYIPFAVQATDGLTGAPKRYVPPAAFQQAEDKSGLWTLDTEGKCFFIKGEVVDTDYPPDELEWRYPDSTYIVKSVHTRDYGTEDMHHWEVGAC